MDKKRSRFLNEEAFNSKHITFACELSYYNDNDEECFSIIKTLVLLNKYFGGYSLTLSEPNIANEKDFTELQYWEDLVLSNFEILYNSKRFLMYINPYLFVEIEGQISKMGFSEGITLSMDKNGVGISVFPNVYTNNIYNWEENKKISFNNSNAALRNRINLQGFLEELEVVLKGEITDWWSANIDNIYIYKHGIKEDAILK